VVFAGRFDHAVDDKGRVSIPARFREILARDAHESLYITNFIVNGERCLDLYTPSEWIRVTNKLRSARRTRETELFQTFFIGGAHEVPVDNQGRILVPPKLREFAHLQRDVSFSALVDHVQLWDTPTLQKILSAAEEMLLDPAMLEKVSP
jgi:MraZ protein